MLTYNEFIQELDPQEFEGSGYDLITNSFVAGEFCTIRAFALYSMVCTIGYGEGILINADSYEEALFNLTLQLNPEVKEKRKQRRKNKSPQKKRRTRYSKNIYGRCSYRELKRYKGEFKVVLQTRGYNFKPLSKGFVEWSSNL